MTSNKKEFLTRHSNSQMQTKIFVNEWAYIL